MTFGSQRIVVDVTTSYRFRGANAVGIVRVEREIIKGVLRSKINHALVRFEAKEGCFVEISPETSLSLLQGSLKIDKGDDSVEQNKFLFTNDDLVISAGLNWDQPSMHILFNLKQQVHFRVIQIVYDLVPMVMPELCVPGMETNFSRFILDTVWTADLVYCISDHTSNDLKYFLEKNLIEPIMMRRIEMGTDLPSSLTIPPNFGLSQGQFVIYVSSIEPRKNHMTAFHVWRELVQDLGEKTMPIIFVGKKQWNSSDLINIVQQSSMLYPDYINILQDIDDTSLSWLYRNAAFTIYPSLYEGWGLPISESLAHGTPCICSSSSSMPEASQGLCDLIAPLDQPKWKETCAQYILNPEYRRRKATDIKEKYQTVQWCDSIDSFIHDVLYTRWN